MKKNWSEILEACEARTGTLEEFAQSKGVSKAALSYQITQRNKLSKFIPLAGIKEPVSFVEIEFPSGIKLRAAGMRLPVELLGVTMKRTIPGHAKKLATHFSKRIYLRRDQLCIKSNSRETRSSLPPKTDR